VSGYLPFTIYLQKTATLIAQEPILIVSLRNIGKIGSFGKNAEALNLPADATAAG